jgi:hypothetical protein
MKIMRGIAIVAAPSFLVFSLALAQERTFTPVDGDGNPTGSPITVSIPDVPDSTSTGQMESQNGQATSPVFQIPDAVQGGAPASDTSGLVPEAPAGGGSDGGE